jgi:exopolyphosphatase/guanosine-5'-triphosphate,3'-diphosphate pyrophosphatase
MALGQMTVRERSVLQLSRTVNFDEPHARHVTRLALQLFDSAFQLRLHELGRWERELLEYTALMHDIGAFLSYSNHQMHTYYLIRNADLLGFDQKEISIMALAGLHHRKGLPTKREEEFAMLDPGGQEAVRVIGMIIRLAETLDRCHTGAVHRAKFTAKNKKSVVMEMYSDQDCQLELWGVEAHKEAFEKTFNRALEVRLIGKNST